MIKVINFDDIDKFKSNCRTKDNPLFKFYMFIRKKLKWNKDKKFDRKKIFINEHDYIYLEYLMKEWAKKNENHDPLGSFRTMEQMLKELGPSINNNIKRGQIEIDIEKRRQDNSQK